MSELITTSSAYIINGDSPMTSVANTVAMTTFAVHTLQPRIFYNRRYLRYLPRERNPLALPTLDMYLPQALSDSVEEIENLLYRTFLDPTKQRTLVGSLSTLDWLN